MRLVRGGRWEVRRYSAGSDGLFSLEGVFHCGDLEDTPGGAVGQVVGLVLGGKSAVTTVAVIVNDCGVGRWEWRSSGVFIPLIGPGRVLTGKSCLIFMDD